MKNGMTRNGVLLTAGVLFFIYSYLAIACTAIAQHGPFDENANLDSLLLLALKNTNDLDFEQAHDGFNQIIQLAQKRGDRKNEVLGHLNMGGLYIKYNAQDEALRYFLLSLDLAQKYKLEDLLNPIYNNIGIVYSTNDASDKAISYYEKALAISRKQNNSHRMALNLLNLGTEMLKGENLAVARKHFNEALHIFLNFDKDTLNASIAIHHIGNTLYARKQYDSALFLYRKAYAMSLRVHDKFYQPQYTFCLGKTFGQLGVYDSASFYLKKALKGFREISNTESVIEVYQWFTEVERRSGGRDALKYADLTLAWKDSLLKEKTTKWVSESQMRYEFGKKETEIEQLQQEATRQRLFWIGVVITAGIIALLLFFILRTQNTNLKQRNIILEKEQEVDRLTLEKNRAEREQLEKDILATEKLNALEQERMKQELTFKDRELATKTLHLVNKNEVFASINKLITTIDFKENPTARTPLDKVKKIIRGNDNADQDWEGFKRHFEEVHPQFFSQLQEAYPTLSANDLRLCAYLLIDLNSKEIAQIYNISPESIRKKKQRLREKLNLEKDEDVKILLKRYKAIEK